MDNTLLMQISASQARLEQYRATWRLLGEFPKTHPNRALWLSRLNQIAQAELTHRDSLLRRLASGVF